MSKMDPKMGAQTRSFFGHLAPFFCARRPWEPKWLPSLPQEPQDQSKPRFPLIFNDFGRFFNDFLCHEGYFLSGLPHHFFGYLELLASLFFVASSPTFQVSGHRFFGIVSRVISELRSTARWRDCRRQLRYY